MRLRRQRIGLQRAGGRCYHTLKSHAVELEMDRLRYSAIWCVGEVDRSSERIGVAVAESALKTDVHNLYSPGLDRNGTAFIRHCEDQLLRSYGAVLRQVKGVRALYQGAGSDRRGADPPCVGAVYELAVRIGRGIADLDLDLVRRRAYDGRRSDLFDLQLRGRRGSAATASRRKDEL